MSDGGEAVEFHLVSYDADRAAAVGAAIENASDAYVVTTSSDPRAAFDASGRYDCVVLEIPLEGMSADEFLATVTDDPPDTPVVPFAYPDAHEGVEADGVAGDRIAEIVERVEEVLANSCRDGGWSPRSLSAGTDGDTEYQVISEAAPIGLFTLDEDAVIRWANQVYMDTLDLPADELIGRPFVELIEEGYYDESIVEKYLDVVRDLLSSETDLEQRSYTVNTYPPSGETLVHDVHTTLLPLDDGEFRGTVVAFRDVTTQKAYEQELERQNDRLNAFSSVVSHDLRNPLGIARGYLDLALEADEPNRDDLEAVHDALDRMEGLVDDLLRLAREGRAVEDPSVVDVGDVARRAWETVETADATLDVNHPGVVLADEGRVRQLFENVYRNSVEHGTVPDRVLAITVGPLDDAQGFFVEDNGPGIPADRRERAFDHGFTTAEDGTGFGLEIVRTIVEAHDWSVSIADSDGGARFEIRTGRQAPQR